MFDKLTLCLEKHMTLLANSCSRHKVLSSFLRGMSRSLYFATLLKTTLPEACREGGHGVSGIGTPVGAMPCGPSSYLTKAGKRG